MRTSNLTLTREEQTLDQVTELQHEPNVRPFSWQGRRNTLNNRRFWVLEELYELNGIFTFYYSLVEVVRRGRDCTRIRRDLDGNTITELVATSSLSDPNLPQAVITAPAVLSINSN